MKLQEIYNFCIRCGGKLKKKDTAYTCVKCGYKHFMSPTPCNGAIIENAKGEILLVERKEDPAKGKWDVPGGFIETGESYEESLKREVREELNIEIEVGETVFIANDTYHFQEVDIPTLAIFSKAKIISGEIAPADDAVAYKFFPKEEILNQDIAFRGIKEALQKFLH